MVHNEKWKRFTSTYIGTFLVCFFQVNLVTINVYQINTHHWTGMAIFGFMISFMWTLNVTSIVFSDMKHRIIYGLGGTAGCLTGGYITALIYG